MRGDLDTAMRRFNQAWTLWEENPEALWGMAIISFEHGKLLSGEEQQLPEALIQFDQSLELIREAAGYTSEDAGLLADAAWLHASVGGFRAHAGEKNGPELMQRAVDYLHDAQDIDDEHPRIPDVRASIDKYCQDMGIPIPEPSEQQAVQE